MSKYRDYKKPVGWDYEVSYADVMQLRSAYNSGIKTVETKEACRIYIDWQRRTNGDGIVSLKSTFNNYEKAYKKIEECHTEADKFFSDLELEYSLTYCKGDGVMILDRISALCGRISIDQLDRLSKSKTRDQAMVVLNEIKFDC